MKSARFLMCPPDYYGIEYEINPWMSRKRAADHDLAVKQWNDLHRALTSLPGLTVELMEPVKGLPDIVFTANAGLVVGDLFISSRFRHPERQGETRYYEEWFADHGYRIERLPDDLQFEGAGDLLRAGGAWFGGYYFRTDPQAHASVSDILGEEILPLRLVDERFYHLDTCFCPIGDSAIYYPGAFDEYALRVLRERFADAIEVAPEEAEQFACNAVVVGNWVILNSVSPKLCKALSDRGYTCHPVELSEFIKSGGSAKCLTLALS
ncbi:MAG: amidinotransferase [Armatimonadetes bacterium]|nr:amidinotransferase [Armatimonadota bacterium]